MLPLRADAVVAPIVNIKVGELQLQIAAEALSHSQHLHRAKAVRDRDDDICTFRSRPLRSSSLLGSRSSCNRIVHQSSIQV